MSKADHAATTPKASPRTPQQDKRWPGQPAGRSGPAREYGPRAFWVRYCDGWLLCDPDFELEYGCRVAVGLQDHGIVDCAILKTKHPKRAKRFSIRYGMVATREQIARVVAAAQRLS